MISFVEKWSLRKKYGPSVNLIHTSVRENPSFWQIHKCRHNSEPVIKNSNNGC